MIRERIENHAESLRSSEAGVRLSLVEPMLAALGWNPADPAQVTPEYKARGQFIDHVLLDFESRPVLLLEVKKLGNSLSSKERQQMVTYANLSNIPFAGLTNGDCWELYTVFESKPFEDRRLVNVSLSQDPTDKVALGMLALWRPHTITRHIQTASPSIVGTKVSQDISTTPSIGEWVSLHNIDSKTVTGTSPPVSLRLPDNTKQDLKSWKDLSVNTITWLHERGSLVNPEIFSTKTRKKHLINSTGVHPDGMQFRLLRVVSGICIHIETCMSSSDILRHTKKVIIDCGYSPTEFLLHYS